MVYLVHCTTLSWLLKRSLRPKKSQNDVKRRWVFFNSRKEHVIEACKPIACLQHCNVPVSVGLYSWMQHSWVHRLVSMSSKVAHKRFSCNYLIIPVHLPTPGAGGYLKSPYPSTATAFLQRPPHSWIPKVKYILFSKKFRCQIWALQTTSSQFVRKISPLELHDGLHCGQGKKLSPNHRIVPVNTCARLGPFDQIVLQHK
jgi:hypothetical protein